MAELKKSGNFFWTCSMRSRKSCEQSIATHAGLLSSRQGESRFVRLGIPSEVWLFGSRSNFRAMNPGDFRIPARMVYSWGGNMYTRRFVGQASAGSIAVRERQCE